MLIIKRMIAAALCGAAALAAAGCAGIDEAPENSGASGSSDLKIVCSTFPAYDWARELTSGREGVEISYLLEKGTDMHSFQPTADDILKISQCDLFVYVGGESDKWAEDAIKGAANEDLRSLSLLEAIGSKAKAEEIKEGMQAEEEDEDEHQEHSDAPEYDEHVWLSVKNAKLLCEKLAEELSAIDSEHKDTYASNLSAYSEKLTRLDSDFEALAAGAKNKTLIFGDRFPFRYFTEDYGFDYYAAFVGCSAETEASFETITFLASKLDELQAKTVYTIEGSDQKIAQTIISSSKSGDTKISVLDSIQSVTQERIIAGENYISIMQKNYDTLKETLN